MLFDNDGHQISSPWSQSENPFGKPSGSRYPHIFIEYLYSQKKKKKIDEAKKKARIK